MSDRSKMGTKTAKQLGNPLPTFSVHKSGKSTEWQMLAFYHFCYAFEVVVLIGFRAIQPFFCIRIWLNEKLRKNTKECCVILREFFSNFGNIRVCHGWLQTDDFHGRI